MAKTAEMPQGNVETLHAAHGTPTQPPSPKTDGSARSLPKKPRGEGVTITIDFKQYPDLLESIRIAAREDDRESSKWLRRRIVQLSEAGQLFEDETVDYDDEPNPDDK